jgi:predicted O-methyltransferase YrrM
LKNTGTVPKETGSLHPYRLSLNTRREAVKILNMTNKISQPLPAAYEGIDQATRLAGFTMASDPLTGCLLRTLAASKPSGRFLELGTGTGLSTAWILDGMDAGASMVSIDNDPALTAIAEQYLGKDTRLQLVTNDAATWVANHPGGRFDYIFADTWVGKYLQLEEVLAMLNKGAFYIVDDMLPQSNWPEGHQEKADELAAHLESRTDLLLTRQAWASGIIIAVKR